MNRRFLSIVIINFGLLAVILGHCTMSKPISIINQITDAKSIIALFPKTPDEIHTRVQTYLEEVKKELNALITQPHEQRTFANTAQELDRLGGLSNLALTSNMIHALKEVHPDAAIREAAEVALQKIQAFWIDEISNNKQLYDAFKAYAQGNAQHEQLTSAQKYYVQESMKGFERSGLDLPDEERAQLCELRKELAALCMQFSTNIAKDDSYITVTKQDLAGLEDEFIDSLAHNDGMYRLGVDYPTYFHVMEHCTLESTRKRLHDAFNNRAYPDNEIILKQIVAKRDELAHRLGYTSFAACDVDEQMVKSVARAEEFLHGLIATSNDKVHHELTQFLAELPDSVTLNNEGKVKPWDFSFIQAHYKKKHFDIDENKISEYFPMTATIDGLFSIYKQFFGIDFEQVPVANAWHEEVKLVAMYNADRSELHGYIFLDLHPRPNKYSHAAHTSIVPAVYYNGKKIPAVSLVMANFPKPNGEKPSLLKRSDVSTFFHEFGHALHAMLGRTELESQSGTNVKYDFVELPSQMLEEWLWDRDMLKMVSKHYKTGESLPDTLIDKLLALKTFDTGNFVQRQVMFSLIALNYYKEGADKDLYGIVHDVYLTCRPQFMWSTDNHFYASWGHLTGYASKYYGYLWSRVFAQDVFEEIKKHGLLNPAIGKRYVETIIGKGGSADPNELLRDFLGREPNNHAFLRDLGFKVPEVVEGPVAIPEMVTQNPQI
jgi:thimet oligopeptidase